MTLREFCMKNNEDPGNWSKLERGKLPPPQSKERLATIADYLKIREGTDEWQTFHDLAYAEQGRIPDDLMSDEELVKKLPIFFRTLRGEKLTDEEINEIIRIVKEE
jgi:transcriptional regulator with XRE-family HTH domain